MIVESLLGGVFGGLLRLAPEVMKLLDAKSARGHELLMLQAEMEFAKIKAEAEMRQTEAALSGQELQAIISATQEQGATAAAGGWVVSALSALVRPLVTYWFVGLYSVHKIAALYMAHRQEGDWTSVMATAWGEQDWTVFSMLLGFWFIGRVWERSEPRRG